MPEWGHGEVKLEVAEAGIVLYEPKSSDEIALTPADLRWLVTTAGPAALAIVAPLATGVPEPRPATATEPTPPAQASLLD